MSDGNFCKYLALLLILIPLVMHHLVDYLGKVPENPDPFALGDD